MSTSSNTAGAIPQRIPTTRSDIDAIDLLVEDHRTIKFLFQQFDATSVRARATKKKLVTHICLALTKHATAEEEIFYPAVRAASSANEDLVDEATVEHASAKALIAELLAMEPSDALYDAKVKVLAEQIDHHVDEEESEMFPKARQAMLDLVALGEEIAVRKAQVTLPVIQ